MEDTGFEFRNYEEGEIVGDVSGENVDLAAEEREMLQLPGAKKSKKKFPYIRRDCKIIIT